jgi:hypothetical protein
MAIRLRQVDGVWVALCAAKSVPQADDVYLDDRQHTALSAKFARDFNCSFETDLPYETALDAAMDAEEDNNPNRDWWNEVYSDANSI